MLFSLKNLLKDMAACEHALSSCQSSFSCRHALENFLPICIILVYHVSIVKL